MYPTVVFEYHEKILSIISNLVILMDIRFYYNLDSIEERYQSFVVKMKQHALRLLKKELSTLVTTTTQKTPTSVSKRQKLLLKVKRS
jgi:hypothetical protein